MINILDLKRINFIEKDLFVLFDIKNFLDDKTYNELKNNFPSKEYFIKSNNGGKVLFNSKQKIFHEFINRKLIWKKFYKFVSSKEFIFFFLKILKKDLKYPNSNEFYIKNDYLKKIFNLTKIKYLDFNMQFSLMKKGDFIAPHIDDEKKILTLMLYFPDDLDSSKYGTSFYKKNHLAKFDGNFWDKGKLNDAKIEEFKNKFTLIDKAEFSDNRLVGFVPNDNSWHAVDKIEKDILRKSVNLNLNLIK